jgi:hypothetical protein
LHDRTGLHDRRGGGGRGGRRLPGSGRARPGAADGGGGPRAVADEHRRPAARGRSADDAGFDPALRGRGLHLGGVLAGLRRLGSRLRRRGSPAEAAGRVGVDGDDRRPDVDGLALRHEQLGDDAGIRRRQLDERLRRLDLDERVVDLHGVAGLDPPRDDLGLGEALPGVGEAELLDVRHRASL